MTKQRGPIKGDEVTVLVPTSHPDLSEYPLLLRCVVSKVYGATMNLVLNSLKIGKNFFFDLPIEAIEFNHTANKEDQDSEWLKVKSEALAKAFSVPADQVEYVEWDDEIIRLEDFIKELERCLPEDRPDAVFIGIKVPLAIPRPDVENLIESWDGLFMDEDLEWKGVPDLRHAARQFALALDSFEKSNADRYTVYLSNTKKLVVSELGKKNA